MQDASELIRAAIVVLGELEALKACGGTDDEDLRREIEDLGILCDEILAEIDRQPLQIDETDVPF